MPKMSKKSSVNLKVNILLNIFLLAPRILLIQPKTASFMQENVFDFHRFTAICEVKLSILID